MAGRAETSAGPTTTLDGLGLTPGERVRWRQKAGGRWREGTVTRRERDGSVGVRDGRGASRAFLVDRLEVLTEGPRGGRVWEPLADRAARHDQMALWSDGAQAADDG